jgi:hypothetical protein
VIIAAVGGDDTTATAREPHALFRGMGVSCESVVATW